MSDFKRTIYSCAITLLFVPGTIVAAPQHFKQYPAEKYHPIPSSLSGSKSALNQVHTLLKRHHPNRKVPRKQLETHMINGMVKGFKDPYSYYLSKERFTQFKKNLNPNYVGIGIQIGIRNKRPTIIATDQYSTALQAGLLPSDEIISINHISVKSLSISEIQNRLKGKHSSIVTLQIRRSTAAKPLSFNIERKPNSESPIQSTIIGRHIGYINIPSFQQKNLHLKVKTTLEALQSNHIKGLIIDLRNNGGGRMQSAIAIASYFIPKGPILYVINRNGKKKPHYAHGTSINFSAPIVVLVNKNTASAAEILAGALQDYKKATILGTQTFGKTSIQKIFPLSNGGALICSIATYISPSGNNYHSKGLTPNKIVPIPPEYATLQNNPQFEYNENTDYQLQRAIDYLAIL